MTGQDRLDLSGHWPGIFNYPSHHPPGSFEATMRDSDGLIAGTVWERDGEPASGGGVLHSVIEGRRLGKAVTFTKIYDDLERCPDAIFYSGTVDPEGNEISGQWSIPGIWSGTFLMIRSPGAEQAVESRESQPVDAGR